MPQSWKILDPTAIVKKPETVMPPIPDLSGKVVSFVSNEGWVCLPVIWKKLDEVLRDKHGVAETFLVAVPVGHQAPAEVLDDVAAKSQAAIAALGN